MTFLVTTADQELRSTTSGAAADHLFEHGFADPEREPRWHLLWCLDRAAPGEEVEVGDARVVREQG
ncbi:hypothetical protein [Quadrisphaera setariae]|uniref:Uncharacterized protein n=1 Tax=Quadrisphaera setariae TaxID=2593304 RepID=A0A5C8ZHP3_9ACTN|nr:hypothetical protein [Quadrisphaera setariae]TXR57367.1 hypothetical protein FMM08_03705 [Quadrisphaera setariae]